MKYFTLEEFSDSETAKKLNIDNSIPDNLKDGIIEFIETLLDPLREAWGSPITVSSGYRCAALNSAIGGSNTSSHSIGLAVDLIPAGRDINRFKEFVKDFLYSRNFDQYIDEYSGKSHWVHIGYKNQSGQQRKQYLLYKNNKYSYLKN